MLPLSFQNRRLIYRAAIQFSRSLFNLQNRRLISKVVVVVFTKLSFDLTNCYFIHAIIV